MGRGRDSNPRSAGDGSRLSRIAQKSPFAGVSSRAPVSPPVDANLCARGVAQTRSPCRSASPRTVVSEHHALPQMRPGRAGQSHPTPNLEFFGVIHPVGSDVSCGGCLPSAAASQIVKRLGPVWGTRWTGNGLRICARCICSEVARPFCGTEHQRSGQAEIRGDLLGYGSAFGSRPRQPLPRTLDCLRTRSGRCRLGATRPRCRRTEAGPQRWSFR